MSRILRALGSTSRIPEEGEEIVVEIDNMDEEILTDSESEDEVEDTKNGIIYEVEGTHYRYVDKEMEKNRTVLSENKKYEEEEYNFLVSLHNKRVKKKEEEEKKKKDEKESTKGEEDEGEEEEEDESRKTKKLSWFEKFKRLGLRQPGLVPLIRVIDQVSREDKVKIGRIFIKIEKER